MISHSPSCSTGRSPSITTRSPGRRWEVESVMDRRGSAGLDGPVTCRGPCSAGWPTLRWGVPVGARKELVRTAPARPCLGPASLPQQSSRRCAESDRRRGGLAAANRDRAALGRRHPGRRGSEAHPQCSALISADSSMPSGPRLAPLIRIASGFIACQFGWTDHPLGVTPVSRGLVQADHVSGRQHLTQAGWLGNRAGGRARRAGVHDLAAEPGQASVATARWSAPAPTSPTVSVPSSRSRAKRGGGPSDSPACRQGPRRPRRGAGSVPP